MTMPHDIEPVRFSRLKFMGESPAHYAANAREDAAHKQRGSAVHSLILGGAPVVLYPGKVRRGKEWDAFRADQDPTALILTNGQYSMSSTMAASVQSNALAMKYLEGERERTLRWKIGQRECQGTPDVVSDRFVTELKTSKSSRPHRFQGQGIHYGYHAQLAWYLDGVRCSYPDQPEAAYVVAVESTAPFPVTVFRLTPRALDQGRRLVRLWWELLMGCEASNEWPAYAQDVCDFDVPDDLELDFSAAEVEAAKPDWASDGIT